MISEVLDLLVALYVLDSYDYLTILGPLGRIILASTL